MENYIETLSRKKSFDPRKFSETHLARRLSRVDLTALGVASTLGAGIYVITGVVARNVSGPGIVLSFFIAGIASLLSALCYAEFASRVPRTGSSYSYSYVTIGEFCAFVVGWNLILEYLIGTSSVARGWTEYLDTLLDGRIQNFTEVHVGFMRAPLIANYPDFLAFFLTLFVTVLLCLGVAVTSKTNSAITAVNLTVILFVCIIGFSFAARKNWANNFLPFGFSGVLAGAATCFFSFVGFDVIATSAEEALNPTKDLPISMVLTIGICFIAYFGVSAALTLMWPYNLLPERGALPKVFALRGASWAQYVIAVGALCGLTASLIGALFPLPRLLYAMATDGLLFKWLAQIHPKTEIPIIATIISGVLAAILALIFELQELVEMMSIGTLLAYTVVAFCVLLLRYKPGTVGVTMTTLSDLNDPLAQATTSERIKLLADSTQAPTKQTSLRATTSICVASVLFIFASALAICGEEALLAHEGWAVFLACLIGVLLLVTVMYLFRQPRNETPLPFMVPLVPWIPLLSMFVNIFLMLKLSYLTWIRFAVWLVIGMCIYFFYGIRHSVEGERLKEQGNYIPLQQVDKEDPKESEEDPKESDEEPPSKTDEDKPAEEKDKTSEEDKDDKFSAPS